MPKSGPAGVRRASENDAGTPSRAAPRFGARRFCCSIIIYECSSKNAFVFSRAGIFCPTGAEGRAAPPRNGIARRPNVRVCPPSRGCLCRRRGKALRARTGFFRSRSRPQALPRTEIYCENGNLLQKHGGVFRVSCSCRLCAARFARTRRRWPVRGAVSRIAAARTWLRSARGNMRGKESKNHKRISTAFQPLRRPKAEQIRIAAESNRRLYTYP